MSIRKIIIKILIYVCIVILIYFHKTPHYRTLINLNSENVENVEIYISEYYKEEIHYYNILTDKKDINNLVEKLNSIKVKSECKNSIKENDALEFVSIKIYVRVREEKDDFEIIIEDDYISIVEGDKKSCYIIEDTERKKLSYENIITFCFMGDELKVKYNAEDEWQLY